MVFVISFVTEMGRRLDEGFRVERKSFCDNITKDFCVLVMIISCPF